MIRKTAIILGIFILSILFVLVLYLKSSQKENINHGFSRAFSNNQPRLIASAKLEKDRYELAEIGQQITLFHFKEPQKILVFDSLLKHRQAITLNIPPNEKFKGMNAVSIQHGKYTLVSGYTAKAYQLTTAVKQPAKIREARINSSPFYLSATKNGDNFYFIGRKDSAGTKTRLLTKNDWNGNTLQTFYPIKQRDGYFCTDGQFTLDNKTSHLAYMYYYRGLFHVMDSNLRPLSTIKTIDTITQSNISLKSIGKKIKQSTPPKIVNHRIAISDKYIYVHSALKADNQSEASFNTAETIDVYEQSTGKYRNSFSLPRLERKKLTSLKIQDRQLVALYGTLLAVFQIDQ